MKSIFKKTTKHLNEWGYCTGWIKNDRRYKRQMKKIRRKQERSRIKNLSE